MEIKINGVKLPASPKPGGFTVTTSDLDAETTTRTADGTLNRDRIGIKKRIELEFGLLKWSEISGILKLMKDIFIEVYFPDPESGKYETKTFYVSNRTSAVPFKTDTELYWDGLKFSLIER